MSLERVFIALDSMSKEEIFLFLNSSPIPIKKIKIGLEVFLKYGPSIIEEIHSKNKVDIFLDLKLHDIPVTVYKSILSLKNLPIEFLTIHLSGGKKMVSEAINSCDINLPNTKLLGVSYLTSLESSDTQELFGFDLSELQFSKLFALGNSLRIPGIVCSPHEITLVKKYAPNALVVTPGVRFENELANNDGQKRVLSINDAFKNGADFVVMGRSLTQTKTINELREKLILIENI